MCTASPRIDESTAVDRPLFIAVELSTAEWRIAFTAGLDAPIAQRVIPAGDRARLRRVLADGKQRCGLAATAPVRSCYEAGRDAFWPHRWLETEGVTNVVVDSASIEVSRRARRAKTDRLDARKLVTMLVRWTLGERQVWQVVHVPPCDVEAARQRPRTRATLTAVAQPHPRGVGDRGRAAADHGDVPGPAGGGAAMGWDAGAGGSARAGAGGVAPARADRGGTADPCAGVAGGPAHGAIARGGDGAPTDATAGGGGHRRLDPGDGGL
jgi:hypothetical protein